jgi:Tol biopolymer transport system component
MVRSFTVLTLIAALALPLSARAQSRPVAKLQLEQFFDMESVSNPKISPDGTQIVYTRGWVDKVNDRRQSDMWIMSADGSKNRMLTEGSGAVWSPDGTRIAFTRQGEPRGTQIFVNWMDDEGAESQITRLDQSPSEIMWTPDGKSIGDRNH